MTIYAFQEDLRPPPSLLPTNQQFGNQFSALSVECVLYIGREDGED